MPGLAHMNQSLAWHASCPAIGQLLLRCLNSGIHALAMAGLRG